MDWILLESVISNTMTVSIVIRKSEVCWGYILSEKFFKSQDKKTTFVHFNISNFKSISVYPSQSSIFPPKFFEKKTVCETTLRPVSVVTTVPSSISSKNGETRSLDKKLPFPKSSQLSGLSLRGQVAQVWCQRSWPWSVHPGPWLWLI